MKDSHKISMVLGVLILLGLGFIIGLNKGLDLGQQRMLDQACTSACARLDSTMVTASAATNMCTCENLRTMRGDYGQLFLGNAK